VGLRTGVSEKKVRWREIAGFSKYQISEEGEIKNVDSCKTLKPYVDKFGNSHLILYRGGKPYSRRPAKLLKDAFGGYFD